MILKNSFWTSSKENFKRRVWPFALFCLLLLFVYPVRIAMIMNTQVSLSMTLQALQKDAFSYIGFDAASVCCLTAGAIISAMQGFLWLYNRKKVDMYGSQPISAVKRFRTIYVNGILIYFVPHIIAKLLSVLVIRVIGGFSGIMLLNFCIGLIAELVYFLAIYNVTLAAVMLCGHGVIAGLATCVFLGYEPILRLVIDEYKSSFFVTYSYIGRANAPYYFTPLAKGVDLVGNSREIWSIKGFEIGSVAKNVWLPMLPTMLYLLVFGIIVGMIAYVCYKKRPMEASGVAVAFPVIKAPIKVAICFLAGLIGGIGFYGLSGHNIVFALIGLVSGLVISQFLMEIIYQFDIRALLHGMKSFAVCCVMAVGFFMIFWLDLMGYDRFVPKADDVEYASIRINFDNAYMKDFVDEEFNYDWISEYEMENMKLHDPSAVIALAEKGMGRDAFKEKEVEREIMGDYTNDLWCEVLYQMKSGKQVCRAFYIDYEEQEDIMNALFKQREFKEGSDILLRDDISALFDICEATYYNGTVGSKIPNDRVSGLMEDYIADYTDMTFSDIKKDVPYGLIQLSYRKDNAVHMLNYPVFTTYERTIADLNDCNVTLEFKVDPAAVGSVTVSNYSCNEESIDSVAWEDMTFYEEGNGSGIPDEVHHVYEEPQQIQEILKNVCNTEMANYSYIYKEAVAPGMDIELTSAGNELANQYNWYNMYVLFKSGSVPEFVKRDVGVIERR